MNFDIISLWSMLIGLSMYFRLLHLQYYFLCDLCCIPNSYEWTTLKTQNVEHFACTARFLPATVLNFVLSGFENKIVEVEQEYC